MKWKVLTSSPIRTLVVVLDTDEEAVATLTDFARVERIAAAHFTAIGAFREVRLGYWDGERKGYRHLPMPEQVEVLSLVGNIALAPEGLRLHAHVVVGKSDGSAHGGHLLAGIVRPTL